MKWQNIGVLFILIILLSMIIGIYNWRLSIYGLLYYLPFAGIPVIFLSHTKLLLLLKDILFVIPAYLGFFITHFIFKTATPVPKQFKFLVYSFFIIVIAQLFNPSLSNILVGLIGVKVWLFYIPLFFLSYHLIDTKDTLIKLTKILLIISLVPFVFGILQAAFLYSGYEYIVYQFYGNKAAQVTQNFAQSNFINGGYLRRIPSIFQFATQYYGYNFVMLTLTGAILFSEAGELNFKMKNLCAILVTTAGFLSGVRRAFLFIPLFWLLTLILTRRLKGMSKFAVIGTVVVLVSFYILGAQMGDVYGLVNELSVHYAKTTVSADFIASLKIAPIGLGTGMNTNPARHAFSDPSKFIWLSENYYAKAVYELGIIGFLLVTSIFLVILINGYKNHLILQDSTLRYYSAAFLSFFVVIIIESTKAQPLDMDPINVYFWIFAGILFKLPTIKEK